jgi:hypothetical protein
MPRGFARAAHGQDRWSRSQARTVEDIRRDLARAVVMNGWGLLELHSSVMSLEDIFIKLTTAEEIHASDTDQS